MIQRVFLIGSSIFKKQRQKLEFHLPQHKINTCSCSYISESLGKEAEAVEKELQNWFAGNKTLLDLGKKPAFAILITNESLYIDDTTKETLEVLAKYDIPVLCLEDMTEKGYDFQVVSLENFVNNDFEIERRVKKNNKKKSCNVTKKEPQETLSCKPVIDQVKASADAFFESKEDSPVENNSDKQSEEKE